MRGLADVLAAEGVAAFSVQSVADRAGVSHRTVYRHFPSREALLEGLTDHLEDPMRTAGLPGVPTSLDETVELIEPLFAFFEDHAPMIEALVVVRLALGIEPKRSAERTAAFVDFVRAEAPHLSPGEIRAQSMGLRALGSSQHWYVLTRRLGLSSAEAAEVTAQTMRAQIGQIRRQDSRQRTRGTS